MELEKISDMTSIGQLDGTELLEFVQGGVNKKVTSGKLLRAIFNDFIMAPNATTSIASIGNSVTSVGTLSHPTVSTNIGRIANFASAASINATAGSGSSSLMYLRGNSTGPYQGFGIDALLGLLDAGYNESGASTGSRAFIGFTDQTLADMVSSDNPAGNYCGFFRCSVNGGLTHTNWQFATKDGSTLSLEDTGVPFVAAALWEFNIFCDPAGAAIDYSLRNVTSGGALTSGDVSANLPAALTLMRSGFQLATVNATARNFQMASFRSRGLYTQV